MKIPVIVFCLWMSVAGLGAQGLVNFNNRVLADANGPAIDAPIYLSDGTKVPGGIGYHAALYGSLGLVPPSSLVLLTNPITGQGVVDFRTTTATYGYVNVGLEGARAIAGAGYGSTVTLQIRAWYGNYGSYEEAELAGEDQLGESPTFTATTSLIDDPEPSRLVTVQSFTIVPEPSIVVIAISGLGALALFRRRRQ